VAHGLRDYALTSALRDSRFDPIGAHEVKLLRCDVSLLTNFEATKGVHDWEVGTHGITIQFMCPTSQKRYSATFLPEVAMEQGWDHQKTLRELIYKSGYRGDIKRIQGEIIQVTRYQSSKCSLTYPEYIQLRTAAGKYNQAVPPSLSHAGDEDQEDSEEEEDEEEPEEEDDIDDD